MSSIQRSIQKAKKALKYYLNGAAPENNLAVRDLLADVKHYCDAHTIDFYAELETAHRHYTEEVVEARRTKKQRRARCPKAKDKFPCFLHQPKAQRRLNTMTNCTQSKHKFLVISYDDDQQQQWFYDFVVAASEQAAVDKVCAQRYYVIAADALSPENLSNLAQALNEETIEGSALMTKHQQVTKTIWTPGGPDDTWTVQADPDRYGSYVIEQARYEQEEWATEPEDENEIDLRLAAADTHDQANARLIGQVPRMAKVLNKFVDTIIATGGLVRFANGTFGCAGDEDWLDLADAAILAQEVLNSAGVEVEIPITDETEVTNGQ